MKILHMIGNAHLDPVWLWRWQEGFQENKATLKSALDRLNEYDDIIFTSSSAQFYEWIEDHEPQLFSQIGQRIREGRWIICGGWWIQPDCNLPCGESFARHTLISQNYFKEKFGVTATVGYNVDSFGHNGMLPQILKLSGMKYYVFMRPDPSEKELPGRNFVWESNDGSQVLACRIPFSYCTFGNLQKHIEDCIQEFDPQVDCLMCFYGVGNHGGGPTIKNIEDIKSIQNSYSDVRIVFSDPNKYFEELEKHRKNLPVVYGDLQHHSSGCYSVQSEVKTMNRRAENSILRAEKWAVISSVLGYNTYPNNFTTAWKRILFNQFHDILAGTSIAEAYEDARNEFGEALSIAAHNENAALQSMSFHINIEQEERMLPVVVFNSHSWDTESAVEVELGHFLNQHIDNVIYVVNSQGDQIPCQVIVPNAKAENRIRIVFLAKIPALGYEVFRLYGMQDNIERKKELSGSSEGPLLLENDLIRVQIDRETGGIASIYDKEANQEFLNGIGALPVIIKDDSDTWSHGVTRFDREEGVFIPTAITVTEDGLVRKTIRVISKYQSSTLVQNFTLYCNAKDIVVSVKLNWQEKFKCLKLKFPVDVCDGKATYEIPFGSISKECNGEEEPMQRWFDVSGIQSSGKLGGLSIINENKYSACVDGNMMAMTILRSPVYAHHTPFVLEDEIDDYQFVDQGIQSFFYKIVPHMGNWDEKIVKKAYELNQPCTSVIETCHHGLLPQRAKNIIIEAENVIMSAFKQANERGKYVLRIYEAIGKPTVTSIHLPTFHKSFSVSMKANEIKSLLIDDSSDTLIYEMDFLERKI